jgi:hypothetical protein
MPAFLPMTVDLQRNLKIGQSKSGNQKRKSKAGNEGGRAQRWPARRRFRALRPRIWGQSLEIALDAERERFPG